LSTAPIPRFKIETKFYQPTLRSGLSQMRGGAQERARKHIWLLIFLFLFASRQKEKKPRQRRTPQKHCGARAEQIEKNW